MRRMTATSSWNGLESLQAPAVHPLQRHPGVVVESQLWLFGCL